MAVGRSSREEQHCIVSTANFYGIIPLREQRNVRGFGALIFGEMRSGNGHQAAKVPIDGWLRTTVFLRWWHIFFALLSKSSGASCFSIATRREK